MGHGALCSLHRGDMPAAKRFLDRMAASILEAKPWEASFYHHLAGWEALNRGDMAQAIFHSDRCLALCEEMGNPWTEALAHLQRSFVLQWKGESGEASRHLERADRIGNASRHGIRPLRLQPGGGVVRLMRRRRGVRPSTAAGRFAHGERERVRRHLPLVPRPAGEDRGRSARQGDRAGVRAGTHPEERSPSGRHHSTFRAMALADPDLHPREVRTDQGGETSSPFAQSSATATADAQGAGLHGREERIRTADDRSSSGPRRTGTLRTSRSPRP